MKDFIVKSINEFFSYLGVNQTLGGLFLTLIFSLFTVKDIKKWKNVSSFNKTIDIAIWFALFAQILVLIIQNT